MNTVPASADATIRPIRQADDAAIAKIIRTKLHAYGLDIPGTAYFDPELDHLSAFYDAGPKKRAYLVAVDRSGQVLGGAGIAEFPALASCAELQDLPHR